MNFILLQINHATARTGEPSAFSICNGKQLNQNNSLQHKYKFVNFSILRMSLFTNRARCLAKFKSETGSRPIVSKPMGASQSGPVDKWKKIPFRYDIIIYITYRRGF